MKKAVIISLQFILVFLALLPAISITMLNKEAKYDVVYKHDVWFVIAHLSLAIMLYTYLKFFIDKWYKLEVYIIMKNTEFKDIILNIQRFRKRLFFVMYILLIVYILLL